MTSEDIKEYIAGHNIPQLFEVLFLLSVDFYVYCMLLYFLLYSTFMQYYKAAWKLPYFCVFCFLVLDDGHNV